MFRRSFLGKTALCAVAPLVKWPLMAMTNKDGGKIRRIKPARIRPGATVGLIAPASPPSDDKFAKSFANFEALGFKVKPGAHLYAQNGHLAGTDAERIADLHAAFADPEVEVVWCVRGGYGCTRLLDDIDYDLIRRHPKPFIGYSDVTALHLAIGRETGLVTFHGPVGTSDYPENTLRHFKAMLMEPQEGYVVSAPAPLEELPGEEYRPFVITPGVARGPLTGGNLALLSAMAGTVRAPEFKGKLVFIEDVGEQPYRIDRMLTQLLQATDLRQAAGIVLGVFAECQPKLGTASLSLPDTLRDRLGGLGIPVIYGIPFGHVAHQATFPYLIEAELNTALQTLTMVEFGVR